MINVNNIMLVFIIPLKYMNTQYVALHHKATAVSNYCSNSSGTILVEHFFNLIFSEFHSNPPVCVCVQMCVEQPTYCYPNGCMRKAEKKMETTAVPISKLQSDKSKPATFLIPDLDGFLPNFIDNHYLPGKNVMVKPEKFIASNIRPDPFKDRFKSLNYIYRIMPKVHLRYNIREQVRNTRSEQKRIEKSDVSKSRWPSHKHVNEYKYLTGAGSIEESRDTTASFKLISPLTIKRSDSSSKYFKRELSMNHKLKTTDDLEDTTVKNFEAFDETKDNSSVLLENLIDYLVDGNFKTNDTDFDYKVSFDYPIYNSTLEPITITKRRYIPILNENSKIIINETTNVVSMNLTNENTDQNKYSDDSNVKQTYQNVFGEMIETLSKNIDKQNNSSAELMEKVLNNSLTETTEMTKPEIVATNELTNVGITTNKLEESTTITVPLHEDTNFTTKMKGRQRFTRKLQNSKAN